MNIMMNTCIALGISLDGTMLVLQPPSKLKPLCILLASLEKAGMQDVGFDTGEMLILALGAWHPIVDTFGMTNSQQNGHGGERSSVVSGVDMPAEMRPGRMCLGVAAADALHPALVINAYDGDFKVTRDLPIFMRQLADHGPAFACRTVGENMLRMLAAMNPTIRQQCPLLFA